MKVRIKHAVPQCLKTAVFSVFIYRTHSSGFFKMITGIGQLKPLFKSCSYSKLWITFHSVHTYAFSDQLSALFPESTTFKTLLSFLLPLSACVLLETLNCPQVWVSEWQKCLVMDWHPVSGVFLPLSRWPQRWTPHPPWPWTGLCSSSCNRIWQDR